MSDWATRRKFVYLAITFSIIGTVIFIIFWSFWYVAPTCSDGSKNGDETGIDCGGSCQLICRSEAIQPIVRWDPRIFEIWPGVWSAVVYVENPNTDVYASYAPYKFIIYGEDNSIIAERSGATLLPARKTVGVFEGSISIESGKKARRAEFEFGENILWKKIAEEDELEIEHSPLVRLDSAPRIEASVKNISVNPVYNVELVATIFDGSDNTIAASRTFVDRLGKDDEKNVFFTWPRPFELGTKACSQPTDTVLLLDRSGSMTSISENPPEPLTSVKKAASSFVETLKSSDQVGVISFATLASNPADLTLTNDFEKAKNTILEVNILKDGVQFTNIFDAVRAGWQELVSSRGREEAQKVAILLTDGAATNPRNPSGRTEADDISYASELARREVTLAKQDGIQFYTIGLGNDVDQNFLKQIASSQDNFFFTPTTTSLYDIYKKISTNICKEVPARIEITYKVLGPKN